MYLLDLNETLIRNIGKMCAKSNRKREEEGTAEKFQEAKIALQIDVSNIFSYLQES
jgi:hypothetical protein